VSRSRLRAALGLGRPQVTSPEGPTRPATSPVSSALRPGGWSRRAVVL